MKGILIFFCGSITGIVIERFVINFVINHKTKSNTTIVANNGSVSGQNINGKISINNNNKNE